MGRIRCSTLMIGALGAVLAIGADQTACAAVSKTTYQQYVHAMQAIKDGDCTTARSLAQKALAKSPESGVYMEGRFPNAYYAHLLQAHLALYCDATDECGEPYERARVELEKDRKQIEKDKDRRPDFDRAMQRITDRDCTAPEFTLSSIDVGDIEMTSVDGSFVETAPVIVHGRADDEKSAVERVEIDGVTAQLAPLAKGESPGRRWLEGIAIPLRLTGADQKLTVSVVDGSGNRKDVPVPLGFPGLRLGDASSIHAVIIGVDAYDTPFLTTTGVCSDAYRQACGGSSQAVCLEINQLGAAANDAESFATFLRSRGVPESNIHLLVSNKTKREATLGAVRSVLEELPAWSGRKLLFFFAGHGYYSKSQSNLLLLTDSTAVDCRKTMGGLATPIEKTSIGVNWITEQMARANFQERFAFFDACRSTRDGVQRSANVEAGQLEEMGGLDPESARGPRGPVREDEDDLPDVVTFYGTRRRRVATEWNARSRGYFSYYLQQGLRRNLSLAELETFVYQGVFDQTKNSKCSTKIGGAVESCPQEPLMIRSDIPATTFVLGP